MKTSRNIFFTLTLVLSLFLTAHIEAQTPSQRVTLVEQVTSASCTPCANQNPVFNTLLSQNKNNNVVTIKYQRGGGAYLDDMWDFNPTDTDQRIANYYNTFSFPQVWIDGVHRNTPSMITQASLDSAIAEPAWFEIELEKELNPTEDSLLITATVTYLNDFFGPDDNHLRAFFVVIEEEVSYQLSDPPGTNGELEFKWVMRKMLPAYSGLVMGQDSIGTQHSVNYTYPIDHTKIDPQQLEVVAFVQRYGTREIMQATKTESAQQPTDVALIESENFSIFPTLVNDELTVLLSDQWQQNTVVKIFDMQGKLMKHKTTDAKNSSQNLTFNTSKLNTGAYVVVANDGINKSWSRFMIMR